jgi:hypothetical protein
MRRCASDGSEARARPVRAGSMGATDDGTVVTGADPAGGDVDARHVGRGTVGGTVKGGDLDARPGLRASRPCSRSRCRSAPGRRCCSACGASTRTSRRALLPAAPLAFRHPLASMRASRPKPLRSFLAPLSTSRSAAFRALLPRVALRAAVAAVAWRAHRASSHVRRDCAPSIKTAARVATAWDAEAYATAQAARVATARAAWRVGRAGRTGSGREHTRERRRGGPRRTRPCVQRGQGRRGGTRGSPPRGTRARGGGGFIGARGWGAYPLGGHRMG